MADEKRKGSVTPPSAQGVGPVEAPSEGAATVATGADRPVPEVREAHDASEHIGLRDDPSDQDAKLDIGLDGPFPTSDAPANSTPGTSEPAPSSGYDEAEERRIQQAKDEGGVNEDATRKRAYAIWEEERPTRRPASRPMDAGSRGLLMPIACWRKCRRALSSVQRRDASL